MDVNPNDWPDLFDAGGDAVTGVTVDCTEDGVVRLTVIRFQGGPIEALLESDIARAVGVALIGAAEFVDRSFSQTGNGGRIEE